MSDLSSNIFDIFPIKIFVEKNFLSIEQRKILFDSILHESKSKHDLISGDGFSSYLNNCNFLSKFPEIIESIQQRIDFYTKSIDVDKCLVGDSWCNIQNEESRLRMHSHGFSWVTGAIYVNVGENSCALDFLNPNYSAFAFAPKTTVVKNQVESGSLYLFPSYLAHGNWNSKNQSKDRAIISFNTYKI